MLAKYEMVFSDKVFFLFLVLQVETKTEKFPAMISAIGTEDILVRKASDNTKIRIYLTWLQKGKYLLKRRAA